MRGGERLLSLKERSKEVYWKRRIFICRTFDIPVYLYFSVRSSLPSLREGRRSSPQTKLILWGERRRTSSFCAVNPARDLLLKNRSKEVYWKRRIFICRTFDIPVYLYFFSALFASFSQRRKTFLPPHKPKLTLWKNKHL